MRLRTFFLMISFILACHPCFTLTLEEAVRMGLEENKEMQSYLKQMEAEKKRLLSEKSSFDLEWFLSSSSSKTETPVTSQLQGATSASVQETTTSNAGLQKLIQDGSSLKLQVNSQRQKTNSSFSFLNPSVTSDFTLQYTAPLLKKRNIAMLPVLFQENTFDAAGLQFLQFASELSFNIQNAYLDAIFQKENIALQKQELELAEKFLHETEMRIKAGLLAPSAIYNAQARLATAKKNLTLAEGAYGSAIDQLKTLLSGGDPEPVSFSLNVPDEVPAAADYVQFALSNRTEIALAENDSERLKLLLRQAKNDNKLQMDLNVLLGANGIKKTFDDSLSQAASADFMDWQVQVALSQPFGNNSAQHKLQAVKKDMERASLKLEQLKLAVILEVKQAVRHYETAKQTHEQAKAQEHYLEQVYLTEEQKLKAGLSTPFLVQQANKDYLEAKVGTLQAMIDIHRALFAIRKATALNRSELEKLLLGSGK